MLASFRNSIKLVAASGARVGNMSNSGGAMFVRKLAHDHGNHHGHNHAQMRLKAEPKKAFAIDVHWAKSFAAEWIANWNARDLNKILDHYTDDIVFHSPRIAVVMNEPIVCVKDKQALSTYWAKALADVSQKDLHFELDRVYVGSDSLTIAYRNQRQQHVAETFVFNTDLKVVESIATYQ